MKKTIILNLVLLFAMHATSQAPCSDKKVITPMVPKPAGDSIVSVTCTQLTVSWKGSANQSYVVGATFKNPVTGKTDTTLASAPSCNSSFNCTATIPVTANTKVNWSVQAAQVIAGRTYYSYVLRGKRDLQVPKCPAATITQADKVMEEEPEVMANALTGNAKEIPAAKHILALYPNPATSEMTLSWNSGYTGAATLNILDATGKTVRSQAINKQVQIYTLRIHVGGLAAGVYHLVIQPANGAPVSAKFIKAAY